MFGSHPVSLACSLFALIFASTPVQAHGVGQESPDAYQPDGQWRLTALSDGCSVTCTCGFVKGDEHVTLSIKRIHPRSAVEFAVIGAPILGGSDSLEAGLHPSETLQVFDRVAAASIGERKGVVFAGRLFGEPQEGSERLDEAIQRGYPKEAIRKG